MAGTAREGLSVVVHGMATESTRVCAQDVFLELSQQIALQFFARNRPGNNKAGPKVK